MDEIAQRRSLTKVEKSMPERIQRKRVKGWRMPPGAKSVCRPGRYGNPFVIGDPHPDTGTPMTRQDVVIAHRTWCLGKLAEAPDFLAPLKGRDLACYCALNEPCHADNYLELANQ